MEFQPQVWSVKWSVEGVSRTSFSVVRDWSVNGPRLVRKPRKPLKNKNLFLRTNRGPCFDGPIHGPTDHISPSLDGEVVRSEGDMSRSKTKLIHHPAGPA